MSEPAELKTSITSAIASMSVHELTAVITLAEETRSEKLEMARQALIIEFKTKASELGISLSTLLSAKQDTPTKHGTDHSSKTKARVKYRGPNGEEWSGRGRLPNWLNGLEASGQKRDDFAVSD